MRRRTRTRSFLMWASIAVSGLFVGLWVLSVRTIAGFWPPHKDEIAFAIGNGFLVVASSDYEGYDRPDWVCLPAAAAETDYGFQLPQATWGSGLYGFGCPFWLPVLVSVSAAALLWRSGRRVPDGHCKKCGYDLTGNVSGRCPECGRTLEPRA